MIYDEQIAKIIITALTNHMATKLSTIQTEAGDGLVLSVPNIYYSEDEAESVVYPAITVLVDAGDEDEPDFQDGWDSRPVASIIISVSDSNKTNIQKQIYRYREAAKRILRDPDLNGLDAIGCTVIRLRRDYTPMYKGEGGKARKDCFIELTIEGVEA